MSKRAHLLVDTFFPTMLPKKQLESKNCLPSLRSNLCDRCNLSMSMPWRATLCFWASRISVRMSHLEEIIKLNQPTDPLLLRHIITKTVHFFHDYCSTFRNSYIVESRRSHLKNLNSDSKYLITSVARAISNLGPVFFMVLTPVEVSRISISNYESYRRKTALNE